MIKYGKQELQRLMKIKKSLGTIHDIDDIDDYVRKNMNVSHDVISDMNKIKTKLYKSYTSCALRTLCVHKMIFEARSNPTKFLSFRGLRALLRMRSMSGGRYFPGDMYPADPGIHK